MTTSLRVVSSSSLGDNNSRLPDDDVLSDGPDSLYPLQQSLAHLKTLKQEVMTDLARTENTVLTSPKELHMQRLVWRWGETEVKVSAERTSYAYQASG